MDERPVSFQPAAGRNSARSRTVFVKSGLVTQEWLDNNKEYFAKLVDVVRVRVKPCRKLLTLPNISLKMWKATTKKA